MRSTETTQLSKLSMMENVAVKLGRLNEYPAFKRFQLMYNLTFTKSLVKGITGRRVYLDNIDWIKNINPEKGVIFVGNHRSFFDLWIAMGGLVVRKCPWPTQYSFPVRSNFFYDNPVGVFINFITGAGVMYPPIIRDPAKSDWNVDAINRIVNFLSKKGAVLGMHPEGGRGKGPDPYTLLQGKPGISQIMLRTQSTVVPFFINGVTNDIIQCFKSSRSKDARRNPIVVVYGNPVDYSQYLTQEPSKELFIKMSEHMLDEVRALMPREKEIRRACEAGEVSNNDPGWF